MAFTRQLDDPCERKKRTVEATGVLSYIIDPTKYYNDNPCLIDRGIIAGNSVSLYRDNMVDLESDLSGRTRAHSKCPGNKYLPGTVVQGKKSCPCSMTGAQCKKCARENLVHLPLCKMIKYSPKVTDTGIRLNFPTANTYGYTVKPASRTNSLSPNEWSSSSTFQPAWSGSQF